MDPDLRQEMIDGAPLPGSEYGSMGSGLFRSVRVKFEWDRWRVANISPYSSCNRS